MKFKIGLLPALAVGFVLIVVSSIIIFEYKMSKRSPHLPSGGEYSQGLSQFSVQPESLG